MKIYKADHFIEWPEKSGDKYLNIRSSARVDLHTNTTVFVPTDLVVAFEENEGLKIIPIYGEAYFIETPGSLWIKMRNDTDDFIQINPGTVIARIEVYKTVTLTSEVYYEE